MSTVYATEPATSGRVIFETTHGPIEVELWSRECPTTTRLFLQLCQDGYYDNVLFHRIMSSTLIQCGANDKRRPSSPATTAAAASSNMTAKKKKEQLDSWRDYRRDILHADQAWKRQRYEVSSRLRFNHRGQVAMALPLQEGNNNNNEPDTIADDDEEVAAMQPQFFITLEEAPYLDGKHVLFGTVTGPTIFNALRIGRTDADETTHEPLVDLDEVPRILRVKIVDNPIHKDLIVATPTTKVPWKLVHEEEDETKKKKRKRKGKLDVNVLSFGDELEGDITASASTSTKGIQSSHDVLLLESSSASDAKKKKLKLKLKGDKNSNEKLEEQEANGTISADRQEEPNEPKHPEEDIYLGDDDAFKEDSKLPPTFASSAKRREDKATLEKPLSQAPPPGAAAAAAPANPKKKPKVSALQAARAKFLAQSNKNKSKQEREDYTLSKLSAFQDKVRDQIKARNNPSNNNSDSNADTSLAARMARRAQLNDPNHGNNQTAPAAAADQDETYHGQVLETTDDDVRDGSWLATRFKCRQHMDLTAGDSNNVELIMGGDGRSADDYQVVDEARNNGNGSSNHGHHDSKRDNKDSRRHDHHHHHKRRDDHHHRRDDDGGKHRHGRR